MHAQTLDDIVRPYKHLPKVVQTALLRVETHPTFRALTKSAIKVLKALVTRANAKNALVPIKARVDTVALQADVSTKTAQRAIRTFDQIGWVKAASDGRSEYGVYCAKRYVFSEDLCSLLMLPTASKPTPIEQAETQMSDGGIHDLSFKKDQREISLQNRQENHTGIELPATLQAMAQETGIKDTGIAKLRGMAHRLGHKLEDVYLVAKKHLAVIGQNSARAYCYVQAMLANPKRTDFAAKAAQLARMNAAAEAMAKTVDAWRKYLHKTFSAGPGRTVRILHDCAHVYQDGELVTLIAKRDIDQVINDIEDGKLTEIADRMEGSADPMRFSAVGDDAAARAARQLLGQTLAGQEAALRDELASKALPSSKDANLAMALGMLRQRGRSTPAKAPSVTPAPVTRQREALVASGLAALRELMGLTPRAVSVA